MLTLTLDSSTLITNWVVICSPVSGDKKGKHVVENVLLPSFRANCKSHNIAVKYTKHHRHAVELAQEFGDRQTGLIVVGGDGTVHEVMEGLLEKGLLGVTQVAILNQGTIGFYNVTAGLPNAKQLPLLIAQGCIRPSSYMQLRDYGNTGVFKDDLSIEAVHIGEMAYRVVKGAADYRMSLGPMFGIFLNLIGCNLLPQEFSQHGTLKCFPGRLMLLFWLLFLVLNVSMLYLTCV